MMDRVNGIFIKRFSPSHIKRYYKYISLCHTAFVEFFFLKNFPFKAFVYSTRVSINLERQRLCNGNECHISFCRILLILLERVCGGTRRLRALFTFIPHELREIFFKDFFLALFGELFEYRLPRISIIVEIFTDIRIFMFSTL